MAERVLQRKEHEIRVEECRLRVQVQALELPVVTSIQVTSDGVLGHAGAAVRLDPGQWGRISPSCPPLGVHSGKQAERAGQRVSCRPPAE